MKTKNLVYGIIIIVVLALAYWLKSRRTFTAPPDFFSINDTSSVSSFSFFDSDDTLLISRSNGWHVNSMFKANKKNVHAFLNVMRRVEIKTAIKGPAFEKYKDSIYKYGVEVEVTSSEKALKHFVFYENYVEGSINSFMFDIQDNVLFLIKIPGYYGKLAPYFSVHSGYWNDHSLISVKPQNIRNITVSYSNNPNDGFRVEYAENSHFNLYNLKGESLYNNPDYIARYFTYFANVGHEYVFKPETDALKDLKYFASIQIELTSGEMQHYRLFRIPLKDNRPGEEYDVNYLAINNLSDDQMYKVKFVEIDLILKDIMYFKN